MTNTKKNGVTIPSDIQGKINKNILFTGAGFSKNYGGFIINEVWGRIYNHHKASEKIKLELQKNSNYEQIFKNLLDNDKKLLKEILSNIFHDMDEKIKGKVNCLTNFISHEKQNIFFDEKKYNCIFTTNQDLLLERYFLQGSQGKSFIPLYYPFIDFDIYTQAEPKINDPNENITIQNQHGYTFEQLRKTIKFDNKKDLQKGKVNYIKLHGSCNWEHSEGWDINVMGENKTEQIESTNTLTPGIRCLEQVSNIADLRWYIFGYSFSDPHLNKLLIDSTRNGAKLVIISAEEWMTFKGHFDKKMPEFFSAIDKYCQINPSLNIPRTEHLMEYIIEPHNLNKWY